MDILKIYQYALQREYEGKRFFEENAKRLSHAAVSGAFENLAAEEQKHINFIQEQISRLEKGSLSDPGMGREMQKTDFYSQRAKSESLDSSILEAIVPDLPVLRMAYLIERDFAEFYEKAAKEAEGDAKEVLLMLAEWERGHEDIFRKYHDTALEKYAKNLV